MSGLMAPVEGDTASTHVYEPIQTLPHENGATGPRAQVIGAATGALFYVDESAEYEPDLNPFSGRVLMYSTGEVSDVTFLPDTGCAFGYYIAPSWAFEELRGAAYDWSHYTTKVRTLGKPQLVTFGLCLAGSSVESVASVEGQRRERQATARLAQQIQEKVPDLAEADVARLLRVSRITWREWLTGTRVARRTHRQRQLRLDRILELRQRVDPDVPVSHWLDTPVGANLDVTPARLLADGRDQLVAILAARVTAPGSEGLVLEPTPELDDFVDLARVDADLRARRDIYSQDEDTGA